MCLQNCGLAVNVWIQNERFYVWTTGGLRTNKKQNQGTLQLLCLQLKPNRILLKNRQSLDSQRVVLWVQGWNRSTCNQWWAAARKHIWVGHRAGTRQRSSHLYDSNHGSMFTQNKKFFNPTTTSGESKLHNYLRLMLLAKADVIGDTHPPARLLRFLQTATAQYVPTVNKLQMNKLQNTTGLEQIHIHTKRNRRVRIPALNLKIIIYTNPYTFDIL